MKSQRNKIIVAPEVSQALASHKPIVALESTVIAYGLPYPHNLETALVPSAVVGEKVDFIKEGVSVTAMFYGDSIYSIELPQFLELMVLKADSVESSMHMSEASKKITL